MTEQEIQDQLKQNIKEPEPFVPAPRPAQDTNSGQATVSPSYELDEITQYKLHDYFGEQYKPNDEVSRERLQFIYGEVLRTLDTQDYGYVLAKISDLERMIGTVHSDDRLYRLYQWLKLDSVRRNVEAEMGAITQ